MHDGNNNVLAFVQDNWGVNSKILYLKGANLIGIKEIVGGKNNGDAGFTVSALPNPFSDKIEVSFSLDYNSSVSLELINSSGNQVALLANEKLVAGDYKKTFNSSSLSEGLYFYKMTVNGRMVMKKIVLVR